MEQGDEGEDGGQEQLLSRGSFPNLAIWIKNWLEEKLGIHFLRNSFHGF